MNLRRGALLIAMAFAVTGCGDDGQPEGFAGFQRVPAPVVGGLDLPAVDAERAETDFAFQADGGDVLLVYFGYTSCPDVCPTTLSDVRSALKDLGDDADRVDLAMATIDPDRDTPEVLSGYVDFFVEGASALRTTDDARLRGVADVFGVDYGISTTDEGEIDVFHTGSLYAVDDQGHLALTWPFGTPADDLASDIDRLLEQAA